MAKSIVKLRTTISKILSIFLGIFFAVSRCGWDDSYPVVGMVLLTAGIFFATVGILGRLWCSVYIAGHKTKTLITSGPYSISRNPLYFFSFIGAVGVGLTTETMTIPLLILITFAIHYPSVILSEEKKLRNLHGNDYNDYFNTVPRFFPKISLLKEPKECTIDPVVFKKHMFSAMWFLFFIGIIQLVDSLQDIGYLKSFFTIF